MIWELEHIQNFCKRLPQAEECYPFGEETMVFKVQTKMFALISFDGSRFSINLKNTPDKNIELRELYSFIIPGFHMNKKHWNTVILSTEATDVLVKNLIVESYKLVAPKALSQTLDVKL